MSLWREELLCFLKRDIAQWDDFGLAYVTYRGKGCIREPSPYTSPHFKTPAFQKEDATCHKAVSWNELAEISKPAQAVLPRPQSQKEGKEA